MSSDRPHAPSTESTSRGVASLVETRFVPQRYEPNYAYPLLVMFHARGGDEQQMVRSMPAMSWRNYVGLSLRGPEVHTRRGRHEGFGWGADFARPERHLPRCLSTVREGESVRRRLLENEEDAVDRIEEGLFSAIRQTRRTLHVHSERIFLVGIGEGAAVAYRMGLSHPERFAGVVAINGYIPGGFRPLARLKACRDLRILVVHGEWNARVPVRSARRDVASLRAGGLRVAFQSYPCAHKITTPMLSDVDTWLINHCTSAL
ncbi:MAG: alpha/beta hydrolase [Isosphaeraceae bacterium]